MNLHGFNWHHALLVTVLFALGATVGVELATPGVRYIIVSGVNILVPLAVLACILPAVRTAPIRCDRLAWICIGVSVLTFLLGSLYWGISAIIHRQLPSSAWYDVPFLLSFIPLWIGLFLRSGEYPHDLPGKLVLVCDLLIALGAAITIAMHLSFPALLLAQDATLPFRIHVSAFPLVTLITLISIILQLFHATAREQHGPRTLLVVGIGLVLTAHTWFTYRLLLGHNPLSTWQNLLWPIGFMLYGVAAVWETDFYRRSAGHLREIDPFPSLVGLLVPVALVFTAIALSIRNCLGQSELDTQRVLFILISLAVLITLTMIRQIITFVSNRLLYQALRRLYAEMARNAATDPLTGLSNHRYFMGRLNREVQRAQRYQRSLALIFADLDHFKQINDTYGHNAGDQALLAVANCLRSNVRDTDLAARYGGEEFVVLLPETSLEQAEVLAERLRRAVSQIDLPQDDQRRLTMSLGVSAYPDIATSAQSLLATADQAMYRGKQRGRNQVVTAEIPQDVVLVAK